MARDADRRKFSDFSPDRCGMLHELYDFTPEQITACTYHPELMEAVYLAARRAVSQCQRQNERSTWNCSISHNQTDDLFGKVLKDGTTEAAFVQALFSASLSYTIAKACSDPNPTEFLQVCSCDRANAGKSYYPTSDPEQRWNYQFEWDICSDNIKYSSGFASKFTKSDDKGRSPRDLMNRHNSQAGLEVVNNNVELNCFCHGFSGACSLRTCWIEAPSIDKIGDKLKKAYTNAVQVRREKTETGNKTKIRLVKKSTINGDKPETSDLVYLVKSQNFCTRDDRVGSLGTVGRECNASLAYGEGSCHDLCCGRGHSTVIIHEKLECCRFVWCCYVECKVCEKERVATQCK